MSKSYGIFTILITIPFIWCFKAWSSNLYTLKDLSVLAKEKNHLEFFSHALDIKPAQRTQAWKNMVEELGLDHLAQLINKTSLDQDDYKLVHKLSNWPIFKNDEFFNKKRDYIFIREIKSCFKNSLKKQACLSLTRRIYNDYNHDLIFSFDLINSLKSLDVSMETKWTYAKKLTSSPFSEFYCHKGHFKDVIIDKLYSQYALHKNFNIGLHKDCISVLSVQLEKQLSASGPKQRQVILEFLAKYKLLTPHKKHLYQALYFLEHDKLPHDQLDISLNSLKFLSKNLSKREELLGLVKSYDPMPDNIFKGAETPQQMAKIRALNRYFPEYILNYAKTCLSYLKAEKHFKNGNPTPSCHHFLRSKQAKSIVPKNYLEEYNKATYFTQN